MNGSYELNRSELPPVARLHEYFGEWMIESTRFVAAFEQARSMDLWQHVEEATPGMPSMKQLCEQRLRTDMTSDDSETRNENRSLEKAGGAADPRLANGIAVIELVGTLMKTPGSMGESTSTVAARAQLRGALADPQVAGILLMIDSPGGTVSGAFDLAKDIQRANAQKPVYAFIEDLGASAAYLMASGASKIFANDETAVIGSIGTIIALVDSSAAAEKKGNKLKIFATGPLKGAGMQGSKITEQHEGYFQGMVNETQKSFDAAVMKGRGLDAKGLAKVTTGGVFMAPEAKQLGLIDGIMSWQDTITALSATAIKQQQKNPGAGAGRRSAALIPQLSPAGETPALQEVVMTTQTSQPGAAVPQPSPAANAAPATLAELKTLKGSTPEFREKCMEEGLTLAQATSRHADFLQAQLESKDAQIQELTVKGRKNGVPPLTNGGKKPEAAAAAGDFNELVAQTMRDNPGWDRHKAIRVTAHNHREAHQAYVAGCPVGAMAQTSRRG